MKKFVVGNWKMHGFVTMAHPLVEAIRLQSERYKEYAEVIVCPPATLIARFAEWLVGSQVKIGGQDCHTQTHGAFTGDVSATMLMDADCSHVIVGHSERRTYHHETNDDIRNKAGSAITAGLIPIICVGESGQERENGEACAVVTQQVNDCLPVEAAASAGGGNFLLAYEPVWAIGSGKTPLSTDISEMHTHIITAASARTGLAPEQIHVLYGGSVKAANAREIMMIAGVAGVLVGGASIDAGEFCEIIRASSTV